jgi:hypothetical protein
VDEKLRSDWAPEQIAGRIRLDHPPDEWMRVSRQLLREEDTFRFDTVEFYVEVPRSVDAKAFVNAAVQFSPVATSFELKAGILMMSIPKGIFAR